jgi:hypothetical protein
MILKKGEELTTGLDAHVVDVKLTVLIVTQCDAHSHPLHLQL